MKSITIKEVERIAHRLAQIQMEWGEPIPDFGTRGKGKLESCLATIYQTYGKQELYPSFETKVAMLFYLMIKNHPFINGNKRIVMTTMLTFLLLNDKYLNATNEELYQIAVWVASSSPVAKAGTVLAIKDFLKKHIVVS